MGKYDYLRGQRDAELSEPRGYRTHLNIMVNIEVKEALIAAAKANGLSVSTLCCDILSEWVDEHEQI